MDANLTNFTKVTLDNLKISFHSLFATVPDKKIVQPLATSAVIHKNEENLSEVLTLWTQRIQILSRIHIYPESWAIRMVFYWIRHFRGNGHFQSEEKVPGWPTNPEKFGLM